jgi:hypothetical protein
VKPTPPEAKFPDYPRIPWRRRLLILVLAIVTAITVVLTLLYPPGGVQRKRHAAPDAPRCASGQTTDCVGGTAAVIVAPAGVPASAPASAPR